MRILFLNTSENRGGAAIAAQRLAQALRQAGQDVRCMVALPKREASACIPAAPLWRYRTAFLAERLGIFLRNGLHRRSLFDIDNGACGIDITRSPEFQQADVVHLHWVGQGFLSLDVLQKILDSGKPVVWTWHDLWGAGALCHQPQTCKASLHRCQPCPLVRGRYAEKVYRRKEDLYRRGRLHLVAVSRWEADQIGQSPLTAHLPVSVIPNVLDAQQFQPMPRNEARAAWHLPEAKTLLFGAARVDHPVKGFRHLKKALQILVREHPPLAEALHLVVFGGCKDAGIFQDVPVRHTFLGEVGETSRLATLYSAADVLVSSSEHETFGQTLLEAMACGTTPVSFDGSGAEDIIQPHATGYLAQHLNPASLAEALRLALQNPIPAETLRLHVEQNFSPAVVAGQYVRLYEALRQGKTLNF